PGGTYRASIGYQGLTDGVTHSYRFASTGIDGARNVEFAHPAPNDVTFSQAFALPTELRVTALTIQRGAAERSYLRYLAIAFNEGDGQSGGQLAQLAASVGSASPRIQLFKSDLGGTPASRSAVSLRAPVNVAVLDQALELDFGAAGIGAVA